MDAIFENSPQVEKFARRRVSESQSASSGSSVGESNCCSSGAGRDSYSDVELREPTGDVMYKYIY